MIHYNVETVLQNAQASWDEDPKNKGNEAYKKAFMLGWLEAAYESMYKDLPTKFKEQPLTTAYNEVWNGKQG